MRLSSLSLSLSLSLSYIRREEEEEEDVFDDAESGSERDDGNDDDDDDGFQKWIVDPTNANDDEALLLFGSSEWRREEHDDKALGECRPEPVDSSRIQRGAKGGIGKTGKVYERFFETNVHPARRHRSGDASDGIWQSVSILRDVGGDERGCESGGRVRGDG